MKWYAIKTKPGAQQPRREYWTETTRSEKGYRVVSGANPYKTAVELSLERGGFTHYMPAEYEAVRNRNKKGLYELRRFPLLRGYVFVGEVADGNWERLLKKTPGVAGVVCNNGEPFPISMLDIHRVRMFEAESKAQAEAKARYMTSATDRQRLAQQKVAALAAKRKLYTGRSVKVVWGEHVGREATVAGWKDQDHVRALLQTIEAGEVLIEIPYEHLEGLSAKRLTGTDA